jgi:TolA-binding protein
MAKIASITALIVLISLTTGCRLDRIGSQMPSSSATYYGSTTPTNMNSQTEADLAEQVAMTRQEYQQTLQMLVNFYTRSGDSQSLDKARRELDAFMKSPKPVYILQSMPDQNLVAQNAISEADALYRDAEAIYNNAVKLVVWKQKGELNLAAEKFKQVIQNYPSSDKIDDAAFLLGVIYENFKDYQTALTYYQRTYQWDKQNPNPARFKAADILDKYLHNKDKALELYQAAITTEGTRHPAWKEHALERIEVLSGKAS